MVFFKIGGTGGAGCQTETVDFFHSGDYAAHSYSKMWSTRRTPDTDVSSTPVYQLVLTKFGIPASYPNGTPTGGTLPGIDIKRMNAFDAIRLSLAESLLYGEWWDVYEDGSGGVYFQRVFDGSGPGKYINLNIRLCVPSSTKSNEVDMVIVRGYEYPPVREVRDFKDVVPVGTGPINPTSITGEERLFTVVPGDVVPPCLGGIAGTTVYKSYKDPVTTDIDYRGQEPNPFYDIKAFESLTGYIVRITGMPSDNADAARINYSFSDTTTWYKPIDFPQFVAKSAPSCDPTLPQGFGITYYEASFKYNSPDFLDRYGTPWPLIKKPTGVYYLGSELITIYAFGTDRTIAYVHPVPEFNSLDAGSGWVYTVEGRGEYDITLLYQPNLAGTTFTGMSEWDFLLAAMTTSQVDVLYSDGLTFQSAKSSSYSSVLSGSGGILGVKGKLGYLVSQMWLSLEVDRPSVVVSDPEGEALQWASALRVEYAPIVIIDEPAPIAYYHKDRGGHIVDQSVGLEDHDPTTCQNFEESELEQMQDLVQGNVTDVSLPFCSEPEQCLQIATTIFNYMTHNQVQTYSIICAPDDEPELGAGVSGFSSDLVIQEISYSYTDASSYTVEVRLGSIFSNIGSWNNGGWIRKREDVSRAAIIRWVAGDGVNYRVEVQGLGMYNAINTTKAVYYVGEEVQVTVYNMPVEE